MKLKRLLPRVEPKLAIEGGVILILFLAAVYIFNVLYFRLMYESSRAHFIDTPMYWAVGRGILNGLTPYLDLFETKPPGIFLLSALSFWLFDTPTLTSVLQAVVIGGVPVLAVIYAFYLAKENKLTAHVSAILILLAFVFGSLLAMYTAFRSGKVVVESFGSFFIIAYLLTVAMGEKKWSKVHTALAALCLLIGIGFKEPFIIVAFAGALLLTKNLVKKFFIPLLIAAAAGIIILFLLDYMQPFFSLYLKEMITHRISPDSIWMRGLTEFGRPFVNVEKYSFLLARSILVLAFAFVTYRVQDSIKSIRAPNGNEGKLVSKWLKNNSLIRWPLVRDSAFCAPKAIGSSTSIRYWSSTRLITAIIPLALALYLSSLAVGMGGDYFKHHFVFAVPVYAALLFVFLQYAGRHWSQTAVKIFVSALVLLSVFGAFHIPLKTYAWKTNVAHKTSDNRQFKADIIDSILDNCGLERYLFLGSVGRHPYGYTKHSPIGPFFFQDQRLFATSLWFRDGNYKYNDEFLASLQEADVIVMKKWPPKSVKQQAMEYVTENFSTGPWKCAEEAVENYKPDIIAPYDLLYRVNDEFSN